MFAKAYKEVRFSMDGLVINRSVGVSIPTHLALHHHGDEPEVTQILTHINNNLATPSPVPFRLLGTH